MYKGAVRSASLAILDRFRLSQYPRVTFATKDLNSYVRDSIKCAASRRRKIVAACLSAGVKNKWIHHIEVGYWNFTNRAEQAFTPED